MEEKRLPKIDKGLNVYFDPGVGHIQCRRRVSKKEKSPKIVDEKASSYFHPGVGHAKGRGGKRKDITFEIVGDFLLINGKERFAMDKDHRYFNVESIGITENPLGYRIKEPKDGSSNLSFSDPIEEITSTTFKVAEDFDIDGASVRDVLLLIEDYINECNDVYLTKDEAIAALKAMAPIIYFKKLPVDHGRIDISSYAQYGFKCQAVGMTYNGKSTECLLQFYLPEVK